jgi:hypothetical protein
MTARQPSKATTDDDLTINAVRNVVYHRRWCAP